MNGASRAGYSGRLRALPGGARKAASKIELLLAEKYTACALMRTAVAVLALPLATLTTLVITSGYYHVQDVPLVLVPLLLVCTGLVGVGTFLLVGALDKLRQIDERIEAVKEAPFPPCHGVPNPTDLRDLVRD